MVLDKTLESPLDCKKIQLVNAKGNQSWIFIGSTESEPEIPIIWPTVVENRLIRKDCVAGKDWRQEKKRTTEDEMVGWHHWLDGHEFEQGSGVGEGQGGLACCSPWGCRVGHDWAIELNWTYFIANTICNWHVSPARPGLPKAPTLITNKVCTHAWKSVPSIHKAYSEFWLQGDLHFGRHRGAKDTFIHLSQTTPK